jgi:hypothetical protein
MMSSRSELLESIVSDPGSTEAERTAAQRELDSSNHVSQDVQDAELDSYLIARGSPHRTFEALDKRRTLSSTSQQLLNDMTLPTTLVLIPDAGTEGRLKDLLDRTKIERVRIQVLAALRTIKWLTDIGGLKYANTA